MVELLVLAAGAAVLLTVAVGVTLLCGFALGLAYGRLYYNRAEHDGTWGAQSPAWTRPVARALTALTQHTVVGAPPPLGTGPVLYACGPHGLLAISSWLLFLGADRRPPHTRLAVHWLLFAIPGLRELALVHGCISVDESAILAALTRGESVAVVTQGVRGMGLPLREVAPRKRVPGVVRLAWEYAVPLVPVHFGGEAEMFWSPQTEWRVVTLLRRASMALIGYPFPVIWLPANWGRRRPQLTSRFGKPLHVRDYDTDSALAAAVTDYFVEKLK